MTEIRRPEGSLLLLMVLRYLPVASDAAILGPPPTRGYARPSRLVAANPRAGRLPVVLWRGGAGWGKAQPRGCVVRLGACWDAEFLAVGAGEGEDAESEAGQV